MLEHADLVSNPIEHVEKLLSSELVKRVPIGPHVVNPLTVSVNGKGKQRLS